MGRLASTQRGCACGDRRRTERLAIVGHSSGAHLAALLALDPHRLARVGGGPAWFAAFVGISGPYWIWPAANALMADFFGPLQRFPEVLPVLFASSQAPPTLLVHGGANRMVWPRSSLELHRRLSAAGASVRLRIVPGAGHGSLLRGWMRPRRAADPVFAAVVEFLAAPPAPLSATGTSR